MPAMRHLFTIIIVAAFCVVIGVIGHDSAEAFPGGTKAVSKPGGQICPPINLPCGPVTMSGGFLTFLAEATTSATPVYFCGANAMDGGVLASTRATACHKRCNDVSVCMMGPQFQPDISNNQFCCWSDGTNDAGVAFPLTGFK